MAENLSEVLAGAGVLVVAVGFAAYAGLGRDITARGDSYEVTASFQAIDGVSVGTDVRVAGVKVGSVTRIELNPETYYADATFTVREGILIPDDSTALISSEGLLGGNFVEVQPGGSMTSVEPGGEIYDTQGAVGLVRLMMKFVAGDAGGSEGAATP